MALVKEVKILYRFWINRHNFFFAEHSQYGNVLSNKHTVIRSPKSSHFRNLIRLAPFPHLRNKHHPHNFILLQ